jgi:hypothetical protein
MVYVPGLLKVTRCGPIKLLDAGNPPVNVHWIELTFAVVLVNNTCEPEQIVMVLLALGGMVVNVAV